MSTTQMNSSKRLSQVLFFIHLLPCSTGLTVKPNDIGWTQIEIGVVPRPVSAAQNISAMETGTGPPDLVVTPLPWPHGTEAATTTEQPKENSSSMAAVTSGNHSIPLPVASVGCYRDSYAKPRPLPELITDFRDTIDRKDVNKTIMACAKKARERGFKVFGIQFYTECWSGTGAEKTYGRDGTSAGCEHGVGKSGANFVYRFGDYELSPCPICAQPRHLCFPAISQVTLESGANVTMRQLNIGDRVRTLGTNGEAMSSEVIAFLHKEIDTEAQFFNLETNGGNNVKLSARHLIFRKKTNTSSISVVFASEINIGDLLYTSNGSVPSYEAVTRITMTTEIGVYAPLTRQGTLLVDGVLVSCYAHWPSHDAAHLIMAPLRAASPLYGAWKRLSSLMIGGLPELHSSGGGIHWYAATLMSLTDVLLH